MWALGWLFAFCYGFSVRVPDVLKYVSITCPPSSLFPSSYSFLRLKFNSLYAECFISSFILHYVSIASNSADLVSSFLHTASLLQIQPFILIHVGLSQPWNLCMALTICRQVQFLTHVYTPSCNLCLATPIQPLS